MELHREDKRRKETEVTRRRRAGVKRRETDLTRNQFPKCSPVWNIQRDSELGRERRGRDEIEVTLGEKGESKGGEGIKPVITLLSKNGYLKLDS